MEGRKNIPSTAKDPRPSLESPCRILLMEGDPGDAILVKGALRSMCAGEISVHHVLRMKEGIEFLTNQGVDVILLASNLPDAEGCRGLEILRERRVRYPVLVLTDLDDEEGGRRAMGAGAQDFLVKGRVDSQDLWRAIRYARERFRMVNELEKANEKLRELDKFKSTLLSNVSHDLRAPLATIQGFCENLSDGLHGVVPEDQKRILGRVLANSGRLQRMIEELLEMSQLESGTVLLKRSRIEISLLFEELTEDFEGACQGKQIQFETTYSRYLQEVWGDGSRIRQVFDNLISNAIRFTPRRGKIEISATNDLSMKNVILSVRIPGPHLLLQTVPHHIKKCLANFISKHKLLQ